MPPAGDAAVKLTRVVNFHSSDFPFEPFEWGAGYVYIGRAGHSRDGRWGNPYTGPDRWQNIHLYHQWLVRELKRKVFRNEFIEQLWGKTLVCFCKPKRCHGDVMVQQLERLTIQKRVLVCGGRDYIDAARMAAVLGDLRPKLVIHGAARGADTLAAQWATFTKTKALAFPADWERHGRAAGAVRNQQMLDEGKPHLVAAFPGGRGTEDMVRRARAQGFPVVQL